MFPILFAAIILGVYSQLVCHDPKILHNFENCELIEMILRREYGGSFPYMCPNEGSLGACAKFIGYVYNDENYTVGNGFTSHYNCSVNFNTKFVEKKYLVREPIILRNAEFVHPDEDYTIIDQIANLRIFYWGGNITILNWLPDEDTVNWILSILCHIDCPLCECPPLPEIHGTPYTFSNVYTPQFDEYFYLSYRLDYDSDGNLDFRIYYNGDLIVTTTDLRYDTNLFVLGRIITSTHETEYDVMLKKLIVDDVLLSDAQIKDRVGQSEICVSNVQSVETTISITTFIILIVTASILFLISFVLLIVYIVLSLYKK